MPAEGRDTADGRPVTAGFCTVVLGFVAAEPVAGLVAEGVLETDERGVATVTLDFLDELDEPDDTRPTAPDDVRPTEPEDRREAEVEPEDWRLSADED